MSSDKLKKLMEHRDVILLAEIGALIHDLGKLSEEFVRSKCIEESGNWIHHTAILEYDAHKNVSYAKKVKQILENIVISVDNDSIKLYDFVLGHHSKLWKKSQKNIWNKPERFECIYPKYDENNIFLKLITASDTFDSDEDKSHSKDQQSICGVYKSTSFGFENESIEMDKLIEERKNVYKVIINWLDTCDFDEIIHKRRSCMNEIRKHFSKALGETRRAANDVTLWDHSYMTATIMKALVAYRILDSSFEVGSKENIIERKPFKIFAVGWNYLDFIKQSHKIPDIIGRIEILKEIKEDIKKIVEEEYALGNSIYDDDFGIYFLIPSAIDENDLRDVKEKVFDVFNEKVGGILLPVYHIEEPKSNEKEFRIGKLLTKAMKNVKEKISSHQTELITTPAWVEAWKDADHVKLPEDKLVCNVCGKGFYCRNDEEKICKICRSIRNKGRKKEKEEKEKNNEKEKQPSQTVFIDEIAWNLDEKRYENVCLLVAKFDLDEWLDGQYVKSLFIREPNKEEVKKIEDLFWYFYYEINKNRIREIFTPLKDIRKYVNQYNRETNDKKKRDGLLKGIKNQLSKISQKCLDDNYNTLITILSKLRIKRNIIEDLVKTLEKFHSSSKSPQDVPLGEHELEVFLKLDIESRELEGDIFIKGDKANEIVKELFDMDKPKLKPYRLLYSASNNDIERFKSLIRQKPPSPSRLMRIWNNTKEFFENISKLICLKVPIIRECKIVLKKDINNLTPNMAYPLEIEGYGVIGEVISLEKTSKELYIVTPHTNDFLIKNKNNLKDAKILLRHPDNKNKILGKEEIEDIEESYRIVRAYRIISVSPTLFMAIIPASLSPNIVKIIKEEYMKHFGKVFGKLPLHIGLIYFKRKMPLFAVLDSANRMISEFEIKDEEVLQVDSDPVEEYNYMVLELTKEQKSSKYKVKIPYKLGDGNPDFYHPYLIVDDSSNDTIEIKIDGETIIQKHISKIKKDDKIKVKKYYLDFEFLDSNIRRFDIGKIRKHWLFTESKNKPKPYLLWDIDNFERLRNLIQKLELTNTQIMNLYEMLISKLDEWGISEPPSELKNSKNEEDKERAEVFEKLVENAIRDMPLRLKVVDGESGKGKISKEDFEFLKDSIMNGLFFDFVDLWHTILKLDFKEDKSGGE